MYMKIGGTWYDVDIPDSIDESYIDDIDPEFIKKALAQKGRKDPLNKTVNTKSIGSRRSKSVDKDVIAAYAQALRPGASSRDYSRAKQAWGRAKQTMDKDFKKLVQQLEKGSLTKNQFLDRSRVVFKAGYEKAYRLGTDASGLAFIEMPGEDLRWLQRARSAEYKFLDNFADDVIAGRGSMSYEDRATMYVDTVDSLFDAGRVDAYPDEGTKIYWEMSSAEHCGDCIDLAMNSPYTPATLPTTPRAGGTMCLTHCNCTLRIRYERPVQIPIAAKPVSAQVFKDMGMEGYNVSQIFKGGGAELLEGTDFENDSLDWNKLDDMVSSMAMIKALRTKEPSVYKVRETMIALDKFEEASRVLPEWIDPFSTDVLEWHAIGTIVLENITEARRRGESWE